jgi:hypothetical protein
MENRLLSLLSLLTLLSLLNLEKCDDVEQIKMAAAGALSTLNLFLLRKRPPPGRKATAAWQRKRKTPFGNTLSQFV